MQSQKLKVACIQTNTSDDMAENIRVIGAQIKEAAAQGAKLIALPENVFLMAVGETFHSQVYLPEEHPALQAVQQWAKEWDVWILIGSLAVKSGQSSVVSGQKKYLNRSYLVSPQGIAAHYDKIHLFDVSVPCGESHQESARFDAGDKAVIAETPWGKLGMTICYDVRFPQLYRALAKAGAEMLTTPAAFTRFTGEKGGWHILNRARAMETGCFVIAPAQCGIHAGGRKTYGHSLIIHPWGDILAEAGEEPCIITAEIDLAEVVKTRAIMPSLAHDREFAIKAF
jgi:predicted amidohydrolase